MVKVAVAGGTGGLGRHIVEGILATKKHTVIVLSRSASNPTLEALGAQIVPVDYSNRTSLVSALRGVHTVIAAIWADNEPLDTPQLALLDSAVEAGVKRFVPSEFAVRGQPDDMLAMYRPKATVAEAVAKSGLEWTIFENGIFMNYFMSGTKGIGHLQPLKVVVDVENGTATVPGNGEQKVTFTSAEDVGSFVAATLDLERWPENSRMAGDVKTYNEVIALAEKVTGRQFKVTYLSEDDLRKAMNPTPTAALENFLYEFLIDVTHNSRWAYEANLNALCSDVKPVGVEELMRRWWS